jgi:hypothetical protein
MAAQNLLVLVGGKRTNKLSSSLVIDFSQVNIGADTLNIAQGGSGGSAYFEFGSRALRSSFVPANNADLVNKLALDTAIAAVTVVTTWANAVLDYQSAPPGSPTSGDRYLVMPTGTGAFASHDNEIAVYNGATWDFYPQTNGTFVDVIAYTAGVYFFNGSTWVTKDFEATTASSGVKLVGRDIRRDDAVSKVNDNAGTISIRQMVYIKANGNVDLARADVSNLSDFQLGVVEDATILTTATGKIIVREGAIIPGFSSLTPGAEYFVSKATAGAMVLFGSLSLAANDTVYRVGRAISATELLFSPEYQYIVG